MTHLISQVFAKEIKDSRGNPTIKVIVSIGNITDSFSVPSGASTGIHEAHELRDEDGKGVNKAIKMVNSIIAPALIGKNVLNQREIDQIMLDLDGTFNKDKLGGNSMIGVSIACAKVAAKISNQEVFEYLKGLEKMKDVEKKIPYLYINLINGGKHAKNGLAFQEYHIIPFVNDVEEAVNIGIKIQDDLEKKLDSVVLGDEGGFAPKITDIRKPLVLLKEVIEENNLQSKVKLSLDVAATSFYKDGFYSIDNKIISKEELMKIYDSLIKEFNLYSIEDPFEEEDFEGFKELKDKNNLIVVGDDLTVTNKNLLNKALNSINAILIKPNQIGTLTETLETMKFARDNDIKIIVSHRSGETDDDFIADLTYAFNCFGLKAGSPKKLERMVKYKRLMEII